MKPWDVNWNALFEKLLDPYDVKARLFPGLLVLVPAIAFLVLLYGPQSPAVVGLAAVLSSCGGPYLLASFVRTWGQHAQDRLFQKWGAQPSTMLLRHREQYAAPSDEAPVPPTDRVAAGSSLANCRG